MSDDLKNRVVQALGLGSYRVRSISVTFSDSDIPLVTVEIYPGLEAEKFEWITELKQFRCNPIQAQE